MKNTRTFQENKAYDFFTCNKMGPEMCLVCKMIVEDAPGKHVASKHREAAFKELAKPLY